MKCKTLIMDTVHAVTFKTIFYKANLTQTIGSMYELDARFPFD